MGTAATVVISRFRSEPRREAVQGVVVSEIACLQNNRETNAVAIVRPARTLAGSALRLLESVPLLVGADQQRHRDRNIENTCDPLQRR
jgi:hypothetical protein